MFACLLIPIVMALGQPGLPHSGRDASYDVDSTGLIIQKLMNEGARLKLIRTPSADDSAYAVLDSALTLAVAHYGYQDTVVASAMNELANFIGLRSEFAKADSMAREAIDIWKACLGPEHPEAGRGMISRGFFFDLMGRPVEAEEFFQKAIALYERNPDYDPHNFGLAKNAMGCLYDSQRKPEALQLLLDAKAIWEEHHGETSRWVGISLMNLGDYYARRGDYCSSISFLRESVSVLEQSAGYRHLFISWALGTLGEVYTYAEEYDSAAMAISRSLSIVESIYDEGNLTGDRGRVGALFSLAWLEFRQGNWDAAAKYSDRLLEALGKRVEYGFGDVGVYLGRAALCYFAAGDFEKAMSAYHKAVDSRQAFVTSVFKYASEEQKMRFLRRNPMIDYRFLSIALKIGSEKSVTDALQMILAGKAVIIDAISAEREVAYCSDDYRLKAILDDHTDVCTEMAELIIVGSSQLTPDGVRDSLGSLTVSKNRLEAEISRECSSFADDHAKVVVRVADVAAKLPEHGALWEYCKYRPLQLDTTGSWQYGSTRYLALVLDKSEHISPVDLGHAQLIDSLVAEFHSTMSRASMQVRSLGEQASESSLAHITSQLFDMAVAPLEAISDEQEEILISPDGQLSIIPFGVLMSPGGEYLIEKYQISYLSSGRDLVKRRLGDEKVENRALILVAPDFESVDDAQPPTLVASLGDQSGMVRTRSPSDRTECLAVPYDPLPATQIEGGNITELLRSMSDMTVDRYSSVNASESFIKGIQTPPRVLHLATHGYFCPGISLSDVDLNKENPLLYSGLLLAGVNQAITGVRDPQSGAEDGILTALEASGLNLVGTELALLSACGSGLGEVVNAEGAYGLRRAFQHAGVRSVVMSLYDVPDESTVSLMERFYTNWLSGLTKAAALHEASLGMLIERRMENGAAHPLYWGGFIIQGDPN